MRIKDILYFSKADREAELMISDGVYDIICFACPIDALEKGAEIRELFAFSCTDIVRADERRCLVRKLPRYYAYALTAKLHSKQRGIVCLGKLRIRLDGYIPNDISDGEYISFCVQRLDLG